jgi:hypothetical protein
MPGVLAALQRSVHGVLLGKVVRPDWFTHGMPKNSRIDTFHVKMSSGTYYKTYITIIQGKIHLSAIRDFMLFRIFKNSHTYHLSLMLIQISASFQNFVAVKLGIIS